MSFDSIQFFLFFPIVFLLHHYCCSSFRWVVLLGASYYFYATLNQSHLLVILVSVTVVTYWFGLWLDRATDPRTKFTLLWVGVLVNLLILVGVKYLPFLAQKLNDLSRLATLGIVLPVSNVMVGIGVSYYIFQAISYIADIYLEVEKPERHLGYFALYMNFFPKLLQGPIERSSVLLPQLRQPYRFECENVLAGLQLIFWGLFKKVVIANRLALYTNPVFADVQAYSGLSLLIAVYLYAFQLYFDFSGYTDMALGAARMLNINLTQNFNSPYMATSVADFWRRWHISFSRWILDYIFKPVQLSLREWGNVGTASALIVTFLASGIWHGANWGFVIWGGLHGVYLAASTIYRPYQKKLYRVLGVEKTRLLKVWQIFVTFNLVSFAWIFFRANTVNNAWYIVTHLISTKDAIGNLLMSRGKSELFVLVIAIILIMIYRRLDEAFENGRSGVCKEVMKFSCYYVAVMFLLIFGKFFTNEPFAYFRF